MPVAAVDVIMMMMMMINRHHTGHAEKSLRNDRIEAVKQCVDNDMCVLFCRSGFSCCEAM